MGKIIKLHKNLEEFKKDNSITSGELYLLLETYIFLAKNQDFVEIYNKIKNGRH